LHIGFFNRCSQLTILSELSWDRQHSPTGGVKGCLSPVEGETSPETSQKDTVYTVAVFATVCSSV
jgi:hypothetical protein